MRAGVWLLQARSSLHAGCPRGLHVFGVHVHTMGHEFLTIKLQTTHTPPFITGLIAHELKLTLTTALGLAVPQNSVPGQEG